MIVQCLSVLGIDARSTQGTISTTASHSSTAPSLSYLTPASSIGSFRSRSRPENNNPHITGTIQPYLRRALKTGSQLGSHTHKGVESSRSQKSIPSASSFSTAWSIQRGESSVAQATLSLSRKTSSSVSFKTARSASAPALKSSQSTVNTHSEGPRLTSVVVTASNSPSDHRDRDENSNSNVDSGSTQSSAAASSDERLHNIRSQPPTIAQGLSSSKDLPPSTAKPLDTSITSSVLTASTPATSPLKPLHLPPHQSTSGFLTPGGLNQGTQTSPISPSTLNNLWTQFLAGHVSSGSADPAKQSRALRSVAYSETGVQTTPSLAINKFPSCHLQSVKRAPPRLSQLTLQESLRTLRPDFVCRSEQRQRELRRNRDIRNRAHCRGTTELLNHCRPVTRERGKSARTPHFVPSEWPFKCVFESTDTLSNTVDVTRNRPKMSPVEMYRNSKKYELPWKTEMWLFWQLH